MKKLIHSFIIMLAVSAPILASAANINVTLDTIEEAKDYGVRVLIQKTLNGDSPVIDINAATEYKGTFENVEPGTWTVQSILLNPGGIAIYDPIFDIKGESTIEVGETDVDYKIELVGSSSSTLPSTIATPVPTPVPTIKRENIFITVARRSWFTLMLFIVGGTWYLIYKIRQALYKD